MMLPCLREERECEGCRVGVGLAVSSEALFGEVKGIRRNEGFFGMHNHFCVLQGQYNLSGALY